MKTVYAASNAAGLALCALLAATAVQAEDQKCDRRDAVEGWGIWCGVEDYLVRITELSPPAAGPAAPGPLVAEAPLEPPDIDDTDPFGGDPQLEPDEPGPVEPEIQVPDGEVVYYRAAYATSPAEADAPAGIGTMRLELTETAGFGRTASTVSINGSDHDPAGTQIDTFEFHTSDESSSDYFELWLVGDAANPSSQREFGVIRRVGSSLDLMDGKEQRILANGELTDDSGSQILKQYWVGSRRHEVLGDVGTPGRFNTFVGGQLTPLADLQALQAAAGPIAVYRGNSQHLGQAVQVQVDFGAQTFNGNWSGGQLPDGGTTNLDFAASGRISGRHLVAESFSEGVAGTLQASFYQPNAQAMGGAYDVDKSGVGRFNDTFSTSRVIEGVE